MQDFSKLRERVYRLLESKKIGRDDIVDLVLFGSSVRGKTGTADIDVCAITKSGGMRNVIVEEERLHITLLGMPTFPENSMWSTLLHEGISLIDGKSYYERMGFSGEVLYWYDLKHLEQKDKIRFFYALKGRGKGNKGFLNEIDGTSLARGVVLVPVGSDNKMREFFDTWKIPYSRRRLLVEK